MNRIHSDRQAAATSAFVDAVSRHYCYEIHIGARHLGWYAWTGDDDGLRKVADHTDELLERGPRVAP